MEKMLVVVFDNETKAYEGLRALNQIDSEGNITIHAEAVVGKNNDGALTVKQGDGDFPVRTVSGTAIGSLIGLLVRVARLGSQSGRWPARWPGVCKRVSNPPSQTAEPVLKCGYGSSDERSHGKTTDTGRDSADCVGVCNERHATE